MKKLLTAITLISFSFATKADLVSENSILLLCSETNNPEYQYLLFMIRDDGWLYDVIHTKEARLKTYGDTHYFFQTLSHDVLDNSYYTQSWVHENDLKLTLLTTSNFSREFLIDFMNKTFQEIDSGVKNQNLSGSCSEKSREYLEKFTHELENQFQEWSQLE
ncbi:hypothetical protein OAL54_06975 [Gammaproteobacteria bacterium]|nr:hypothetical protein [Gammaproteobacteria bacterium]